MAREAHGEPGEIVLAERCVPYRVQRSARRRTVVLTVDVDRGLVVYCPQRMGERSLERILRQKERWILDKTAEAQEQQERRQPLICSPGSLLPWQGAWYPLAVELRRQRELRAEGGVLWLGLPQRTLTLLESDGLPDASLRPHVVAAYRDAARAILEQRVAHFAPKLGVEPRVVRIKDQRKRWGSASARGGVNFNWRLLLAPLQVLDYVVVHELCHLHELNHSPRFWARVADALPDFRTRQAWLAAHGPQLYDL